ncbi:C39 family peptidase [Mesorhizobium escarrei]|uniref:Peptidase_C39_2 domain-containing protein n=1 Tax=Mesorhizobium escarrei TaxID=666018 RepID=A0ABM9E7B0_9HYPH|nr:C39 family peptidase [Mesorhizobium escarrei]CAH2405030.1 Peptidase_C39_2 domain-containing protein [Mesorhizobium escarrei]
MREIKVPYFSQWETPAMTLAVLADGPSALRHDPLWCNSGAETIEEYVRWAANGCGMACLKMILAARGEAHSTISLARTCTVYGGYVVNEIDGSIKGLIYAPFVTFVVERFGLRAEVMTNIQTVDIPKILSRQRFFMASVHPSIRWPDSEPPSKGGHLVLVTDGSNGVIRFHNPSGHDETNQEDVMLSLASFDRFFANRGVAVTF